MQSTEFYQTTRPYIAISQLLGLLPLSFDHKGFRYKIISVLKTCLILALLLYFVFLISFFFVRTLEDDFLNYGVWALMIIFRLPVIAIQVLIQQKNCTKIEKFYVLVNESDTKCKQLGIKVDFTKHQKFVAFYIGFFVFSSSIHYASILALHFVHGTIPTYGMLMETVYVVDNTFTELLTIQFVMMTYLIKDRLASLNRHIR